MKHQISLFDEYPLILTGDNNDSYFNLFPDGAVVTDRVLRCLRSIVASDAICLDVGANIGVYSMALARLAPDGKIYAFEPSTEAFGHLNRNLAENDINNVEAFNCAIGDKSGTVGYHFIPEFSAWSRTVDSGSETNTSLLAPDAVSTDVACTTIDEFVAENAIERLDVIKIDVEGDELKVLEGAKKTLESLRPMVVLEFNCVTLAIIKGLSLPVAIKEIRGLFDHVHLIHEEGMLPIENEIDAQEFLTNCMAFGGAYDDLLCTFKGSKYQPESSHLGLTFSEAQTQRREEAHSAVLRHDAEREALIASVTQERDQLKAELEATHATVSWRVTKPLRTIRAAQR